MGNCLKIFIYSTVVLLCGLLTALPAHAENWKLLRNKEGKSVFVATTSWNEDAPGASKDDWFGETVQKTSSANYSTYMDIDSLKSGRAPVQYFKDRTFILFTLKNVYPKPLRYYKTYHDLVVKDLEVSCRSGLVSVIESRTYLKGELLSSRQGLNASRSNIGNIEPSLWLVLKPELKKWCEEVALPHEKHKPLGSSSVEPTLIWSSN